MDKKQLIELVKQLRQETGAGVMECKKILEETKGDIKKAKAILKKRGVAQAEKKATRETREGYIASYTHSNGKIGAIVEVFCETDFVARNEEFRRFAHELCLQIVAMAPKDQAKLLKQVYIRDPSKTIEQLVKETIAKFGENIKIGRFERFEI